MQGVWTLYSVLVILNILNANKQRMTAAERHWIVGGIPELNLPTHFRDVLASKWKSNNVLHWEKGYAFISTGNEKLWIPSKLIKIEFDQGRPIDDLGYRQERKSQERLQYR